MVNILKNIFLSVLSSYDDCFALHNVTMYEFFLNFKLDKNTSLMFFTRKLNDDIDIY